MNRENLGRSSGLYRVAIVGAGTLKGKELADLLPETSFPAYDVKLLDDGESLGKIENVGEEVTFVQKVTSENFDGVDFAFFASQPDFTRSTWKVARDAGAAILDLSYAIEELPTARVRSPWLERERMETPPPELEPAPVIIAHPAATVLALLLTRAQKAANIRSAAATVFQPASENGRAGMDELHEQTVSLLSFHDMPREVFDAQVAFNLLARYGEQSKHSLETAERRILSHFRTIAPAVLAPSVMLVQAPIFHGHVFSMYVELDQPRSIGDLSQILLGSEHVSLTRLEDSPSNVNAAGQGDILAWLRPDAQRESGFWIWAAVDNLRLLATSAVECAQQMAASRPSRTLQ